DLYAVWGTAPNDVWFAGSGSLVFYYDGTRTQQRTMGLPGGLTLRALSGDDKGNVFVVGDGGAMYQYKAGSWNVLNSGADHTLRGLGSNKSSNPFEMCMVGDGGAILRYRD